MNKFMKKIMSKKDGFTLVELIVVIAILAILAGIAIPAYSGYIKKASEAGDTQIISAVNTAIQAATAATDNVSVSATYNASNGIAVTFADTNNDDDGDAAKAQAAYATYISGNDVTFEYYVDVAMDGNLIKGVAPTT